MSPFFRVPWSLLLLLLLGATGRAGDWAHWRGPEHNGVSREKNLPETWTPEGENLLWSNKVGGMSSPIVMNGRVYTLTRVGEEAATDTVVPGARTQESLICIDAETGKPLWEYRENITQSEVPFHRLGWSNVVGDPQTKRIYALMVHCSLVCLDGDTGKLLWKRQMTEEFGMISTFGGRTPSPTIDEDQVIVGGVAFGWGDNARSQYRLFALNKENGELNWTAGTGGIPMDSPYNTPMVSVIGGMRLAIVGAGDGGVHAFKVRTGEKVWSQKVSKRGINASVLVEGSRIYVCHSEENLDKPVMGAVICLDAADGKPKELWRAEGIEAGFSTPTLWEKRLYVMDNGGTVHCIDAMEGKVHWKKRAGTIGKASLVFGDGKLFVAEANGRVVVMKPEASSAKILSKVELTEKLGREFVIFGSPAISNGRIFVQSANSMYAIGDKNAKVEAEAIPEAVKELEKGDRSTVAFVQVVPADVVLRPGEKVRFRVKLFDSGGAEVIEDIPFKKDWSIGQLTISPLPSAPNAPPTQVGNLEGEFDADGAFTAAEGGHQAGAVVATVNGIKGQARVRVLPPLPWKFDFEQAPLDKPPLTWLGAGGKFSVKDDNGNKALVKTLDLDLYYRARTNFGHVGMGNYTLAADVKVGSKMVGGSRQMPDPGIINSRYVLVLLGNHQRLQIHAWPPTLPYSLNKTIDHAWEPETWYTMKLRVEQRGEKAVVKGKVWPAGTAEPDAWSIELEDSLPNRNGNPGLFGHSLVGDAKSFIYYDNISVMDNN